MDGPRPYCFDPTLLSDSRSTATLKIEPPNIKTASLQTERRRIPPVELAKPSSVPRDRFLPSQKWEGTVLKMCNDSFVARLVDLTNSTVDEEAEFSLDEVPRPDRLLIELGAVFYWDIGYLDKVDGQRMRVSSIRFRRLPAWSVSELRHARHAALRLGELFASNAQSSAA